MRTVNKICLVASLWLATACGAGDGSVDATPDPEAVAYRTGPLAGRIKAVDWTFDVGRAIPNSFGGAAGLHRIELSERPVSGDVCAATSLSGRVVVFSTELETDEIYLGGSRAVSLAGDTALSGKYTLTEVTGSRVGGKLYAHLDDESVVNGVFSVKRCD